MVLPILLSFLVATSSLPKDYNPVVFTSPQVVAELPVSPDTVKNILIPMYASYYHISQAELDYVVSHESSYRSWAVGDNGHSHGLAQINDIYHPEIPVWEAENAMFAVNYVAQAISLGRGHEWTTDRAYQRLLAYNSP